MASEIPDEWFTGKCLKPGEVAAYFGVDRVAVARWAQQGIIGFFRLPNGDRRFPECEIERIVRGGPPPAIVQELAQKDKDFVDPRSRSMPWFKERMAAADDE